MAKKEYPLAVTPAAAEQTAKNLAVAQAQVGQFAAKNVEAAALSGIFDQFEDKSLPPILKARGIAPGTIIMGEIASFGVYSDDKIETALITVYALDYNPEKKDFFRVGPRLALPVAAVLGRAMGVNELLAKKAPAAEINEAIQENGYRAGTVIVMQYQGTGKERKGMNAPHLWDIKIRKATGEVSTHKIDKKK